MTDETTSEQLAEIEGQTEDTPATGYTPPEGWRVLAVGEVLRDGDMTVRKDGYCYSTERVGYFVGANQRYIRPIEPEPQPEPQPVPEPVPEPNAATIEELRSEVSYVQRMLGESRQRVTHLEELVTSLRTINSVCENAVRDAGKENTALRNQLAAVKAELASVAADRQQLRVELDAAQQVPADSPELRQLRADLAEVTQERDTYRHAHELLLNDVNATHQRTKAMTVEAIAEWLEPVQAAIAAADNVAESTRAGWLAEEVIQHLPQIMRHLTGLDSND